MSVTRLKRKHRKNIARANNKQHIIKELLRTPVLKNVDLEELKSRFPAATGVASVKETAAAPVEKVKEVAVAHGEVVERAKDAKAEAVDHAKEAVSGPAAEESADNAAAFDDAEAVTKPVNEDGQAGEHPKPEVAL